VSGAEAVLLAAGWPLAVLLAVVVCAQRAGCARRSELVARARHELAGPLGAAGLALSLARREAGAAAPRLAAVELELRRAARALDDLDAARAGRRARDEAAAVDVGALVAQQALAWQPAARARGRELRVHAPSGLVVRADRVRLAQAVGNLLANALEHGGPRVELRAERGARGGVRVAVGDDGPGLPVAALDLARRPRAGRGARGRGLAIAADVAARAGGRLVGAPGGHPALELPAAPLARRAGAGGARS